MLLDVLVQTLSSSCRSHTGCSFIIVPLCAQKTTLAPPPLQIALFMGNDILNEIMEANLTDIKPIAESTKYVHKVFGGQGSVVCPLI